MVRLAGVHVHIHNHGLAPDQGTSALMQFGGNDNHGDSHSRDVDVDVLDASFLKKPGSDFEQPPVLAVLLLIVLSLVMVGYVLRQADSRIAWSPSRHSLQPARAPPA